MASSPSSQYWRTEAPIRSVVSCTVDGIAIDALEGDTVLTAVLTHRRNLRPFEFDDSARSGFCFMGACQDCWVHLSGGQPVRACTTLVQPLMHIVTGLEDGSDV